MVAIGKADVIRHKVVSVGIRVSSLKLLERSHVVWNIGVGIALKAYLVIINDSCFRQTYILAYAIRYVEGIKGEWTNLIFKFMIIEIGNRIWDMNFGEIDLHELLHLKISSICSVFIVDRKCKTLGDFILRNTRYCKIYSIRKAIAWFNILVVGLIDEWIQPGGEIVFRARFHRCLYNLYFDRSAIINISFLEDRDSNRSVCPIGHIMRVVFKGRRKGDC